MPRDYDDYFHVDFASPLVASPPDTASYLVVAVGWLSYRVNEATVSTM